MRTGTVPVPGTAPHRNSALVQRFEQWGLAGLKVRVATTVTGEGWLASFKGMQAAIFSFAGVAGEHLKRLRSFQYRLEVKRSYKRIVS